MRDNQWRSRHIYDCHACSPGRSRHIMEVEVAQDWGSQARLVSAQRSRRRLSRDLCPGTQHRRHTRSARIPPVCRDRPGEHEQKHKQAPQTEYGNVTAPLTHAQTVCKTENSTYEISAAADCEWPAWHAVRVSCERPRGRQRERSGGRLRWRLDVVAWIPKDVEAVTTHHGRQRDVFADQRRARRCAPCDESP